MEHEDWIGRTELQQDVITPVPWAALAATLDRPLPDPGPAPGTPLPALWHWLYFLPLAPQSALGPDGHPRRGDFLPPVALPRRMWAGSELDFAEPLYLGDRLERRSTIEQVSSKTGRSGPLVFVTVRHEIRRPGAAAPALTERHHIVYRDRPGVGDAPAPRLPAPAAGRWRQDLQPDAVLLFRYSALTFNGHRIHYDRSHATGAEGYPGLVVHGPLIATLLLGLLQRERPRARVRGFRFRALHPAFDGQPLSLHGEPAADGRSVALWASDADNGLCMQAEATLD